MKPAAIILTVSVCVLTISCDKRKIDPAESFKTFATSFHSAAQQQLKQPWDGEYGPATTRMMAIVFDKYEIDVKKTDSLISPYAGIIRFKAQQTDENQKSLVAMFGFPVTATFAYQDEKWVLKSAIVTDIGFSAGDGFFQSDLMQASDSSTVKAICERLRAASEQSGGK